MANYSEGPFARRYLGHFCPNCDTVWSFQPHAGGCPSCGPNQPMRKVGVTLQSREDHWEIQPLPAEEARRD